MRQLPQISLNMDWCFNSVGLSSEEAAISYPARDVAPGLSRADRWRVVLHPASSRDCICITDGLNRSFSHGGPRAQSPITVTSTNWFTGDERNISLTFTPKANADVMNLLTERARALGSRARDPFHDTQRIRGWGGRYK